MPDPLTQDQLDALREHAALSKDDRLKDALRHIDALEAANHTPVVHPQPCATAARLAADGPAAPDPTQTPAPTPEARRSEIMAALIRGFEAGYDIGTQTDETPRHLHSLRAALNAGDPDVAEAFWASKAWTDDERKAVKRAAKAWLRFAEVMGR